MLFSLAYWVHDLSPFLIEFPEGWWLDGIRWYGLAYASGFLVGAFLLWLAWKKGRSPLNPDDQGNYLIALILGVVIGGRLGFMLLYEFGEFVRNPLILFEMTGGGISGMASHGGFLGVFVAVVVFARLRRISMLRLADLTVLLVPAGLMFGRMANFINGELWGRVTDASWAVIFPKSAPPGTPVELIAARHPSQLYQAGLEGLLLLIYVQLRFWRGFPHRLKPGQLASEFLIAYSILRILGEIYREPDASLILGMSRGTFYSLLMMLAGIVLLVYILRRTANSDDPGWTKKAQGES